MELSNKKILVTGGAGFLGTAVVRALIARGVPEGNIRITRSKECDLRIRKNCEEAVNGVDIVFHLAANAGGIGYNRAHPGLLFYDNIIMNTELMEAARKAGVKKFLGVGSICSYPKYTPVPFKESDFWNGFPEETNAPYGLAKKMMQVQGEAYNHEYGFNAVSVQIANLYGPNDEFSPVSSHLIPAIILKIDAAEKAGQPWIEAWGTGEPTREFFYVDDAAEGIILTMEKFDKPEPINLGSGQEMTIKSVIEKIVEMQEFKGEIKWNPGQPDGQPRRTFDTTKAARELGFQAKTTFEEGLKNTIEWYRESKK
ncbi:MAG: GDP-L-fucose synthase [Candidatus Adlerbacteria bacterium]